MKHPARTKPSRPKPAGKRTGGGDAFPASDPKRRRKSQDLGFIHSDDDEDDETALAAAAEEEDPDVPEETAAEARFRLAREHLERVRIAAKKLGGDEYDEEGDDDGGDDDDDDHVANILQQTQLEDSGRAQRSIASRVLGPESQDAFRLVVKHRESVTAVAISEDDTRGFSASKDGMIMHWDVESGKREKYLWPSEDVLISHSAKAPQSKNRSKQVLALAVSSDGRYLATGGTDRHVHLWDTRTRGHIQAFPGHKGPVSCLTFRQGTSQLYSGSFDRTIKLWSAGDRAHIDNLFGHQSEVLSIDCLRKERLLTAGRDRTMRLWKVPEESQLVFRAPASSLECSCFINDSEFLSGSDDGSIELWNVVRKKPAFIVKNAHAQPNNHPHKGENGGIPNGDIVENGSCIGGNWSAAQSWVSSVAVCRSSDLAASGAANGFIRLWAIESENKSIRPLFQYPLVGFVNSLAFAKSGRFLLAGVGQQPRLGKWGRVKEARNGVAVHPLRLKEE